MQEAIEVGQRTQADQLKDLVEELRNRLVKIDAYAVAADASCAELPCRGTREERREIERLFQYVEDVMLEAVDAIDMADNGLEQILAAGEDKPDESEGQEEGDETGECPLRGVELDRRVCAVEERAARRM